MARLGLDDHDVRSSMMIDGKLALALCVVPIAGYFAATQFC